jgi:hypothetical protein
MIELITDPTPGRITFFKDILEANGIQTFVRNQNMSGTEGMIPIFHPGLCIVDHADKERALQLIRQNIADENTPAPPDVICENCKEINPGNFALCWNCDAKLPE